MGVITTCHSCGIPATDGQTFAEETVPLRGARSYCPNCHARLRRRFFQAGLFLDLAVGLAGLLLVWLNPNSGFGYSCLNFFLFQLCLVLATVPHELGHALFARLTGLSVDGVVIGFGPPLFAHAWGGVPLEWRQVPYGGVTRVRAPAGTPLGKHLLVAAGGILVNGLLALLAAIWLGGGSPATEFSRPMSFAWLFLMANVALIVHHLVPHARSTSLGRLPSDGLALWQILVRRRAPSAAEKLDPPAVAEITLARRTAKTVITSLFAAGALACFGAVLFLSRILFHAEAPVAIWVATVLFVLLGGTFAWGAVFVYQRPWQSPKPIQDHGVVPHADVLKALETELARRSPWPSGLDRDKVWVAIEPSMQGRQVAESLAFLDTTLAVEPGNLQLQFWKGQVLGWAGRHEEAAFHFADVLDLGDLGLATRAGFLLERCKAHLRAGQRGPAWVQCGEFLDEPGLLPEQLFLLDHLARLPLEEGRPELLPDADYWSHQALGLQPENLTLQATRGALLLEQERPDEALALLQHVFDRSESESDKAIAAAGLAAIARRGGDEKAATRLARQARLLHPPPWVIERLDRGPAHQAA